MKRTPKNIIFHELIGLEIEVLNHPNPELIGVRGVILWETPRTLWIAAATGKTLVILKSGGLFRVKLPGGKYTLVRGDHIMGSPPERARRIVRR
ncbi:MAG: ribonuclease P protein subunit [Desulfurococcales archaeon]|nr:ribonuclease P protein subunit [Desulfurococcales archaeon]